MHHTHCAIYCSVIDNFGDIGVCWRLARQLANEYQLKVTLWVDNLNAFAQLAPTLNPKLNTQPLDSILVKYWVDDTSFDLHPVQLVIEGFACRIPSSYITHLAKQERKPVWLNLEYLSAESWVDSCHLQCSHHPATGLQQYFWFPSFKGTGGGLLREHKLHQERSHFLQSSTAIMQFWQRLGIEESPSNFNYKISLFSYPNVHTAALLEALHLSKTSILLLVPEGKPLADITAWLELTEPPRANTFLKKGNLNIVILPFLTHTDYDRLLWLCDLNMVRGEDSLVRAIWAEKPFLWHIYPQEEQTHLEKLSAFIQQVESDLPAHAVAKSWQDAMYAWNSEALDHIHSQQITASLLESIALWQPMAQQWSALQYQHPDLAMQIVQFTDKQIKLIEALENN